MGDRQTPTIHPSLSGMHTYSSAKHVLMPIFCQFFFTFLSSQFCIHVYNTHASWTISSHSVLWIYRRFALLSKLRGQQPFNTMNGEKRTLGVKSVLF